MRTLLAPTEDFIKGERTKLAADVLAGSNVTLAVESSEGFSDADFIVIGHEGSELAELQQINQAVTGTTSVRVATLKFNHQADEPVTRYRYNKRKFYGSATATGSYTELTADGSPKDIQVDDPQGTVLEYSGSTFEFFKATYFNSEDSVETDQNDQEAVQADESLRYAPLWAIRKHAGLAGNPRYSDLQLEEKRKQAEGEIKSAIGAQYVLPLSGVPALITRICTLLAAGYIDFEEFGSDGEGVKWLGEARALLKAIKDGKQLLLDATDTELARLTSTGVLDGYPNNGNTDAAVFTMADRF